MKHFLFILLLFPCVSSAEDNIEKWECYDLLDKSKKIITATVLAGKEKLVKFTQTI